MARLLRDARYASLAPRAVRSVVELNAVAEAEGDDLLHSLGSGEFLTTETRWFWMELVGSTEAGMSVQDMEGYDELMLKLLAKLPADRVLSLYAPEEVLSRYTPEERLVGLDRDHQALALPVEVLRLLPDQYIGSLSAEVQAEIRRRLREDEPLHH